MIEKDTMVTVFGVILLAISYGLSSSYILKQDADWKIAGSAVPFGMNMIVLLYIAFGLFSVSKLSTAVKVVIILIFITLSYVEIYFMYEKPATRYGIPFSWFVVTASTIARLYFIVSLHCDLTKTFFVYVAQSIVEPNKAVFPAAALDVVQPNWDKAYSTFESALRKTQLSPDERLEQINKFRAAWGKPPKDVVMTGGRRR
uniref:Uncharacterized protein n=1 Tax=viral metagenome TaxID=1070528 RepID=A0A6C0F9B5_9ZZZZ